MFFYFKMKKRIGKYIIQYSKYELRIRYKYTFTDLVGLLPLLLGFLIGSTFLYVAFKDFDKSQITDFSFWFVLIVGLFLFIWFGNLIIMAFWDFRDGIFKVSKYSNEVVVRDVNEEDKYLIKDVSHFFCDIDYQSDYVDGMLCLQMDSGEVVECFVIQSEKVIALRKNIEKDILKVADSIIYEVEEFIAK